MGAGRKTPSDIAGRMSARREKRGTDVGGEHGASGGAWRRDTFTLPRGEARDKAREWFSRFPKAAYMTEIEFWRELADGRIEFTIRRLPSAD